MRRLFLIALLGALAAPAPARGQDDADRSGRVARDARVGFLPGTAGAARSDLETLEPGDPGRVVALFALGAGGSRAARPTLVEAAGAGATGQRCAAVLALGELGVDALGDDVDVLLETARTQRGAVGACALVALARSGTKDGRALVAELAAGDGPLAETATEVLSHSIDPAGTPIPGPYARLYDLRWSAARAYGTVDGRAWSVQLLAELERDRALLAAIVLRTTTELKFTGARDHLLELLVEGSGAPRVVASVQLMPLEVEQMLEAGVWRPRDRAEWKALAFTAVNEELHALLPTGMALASTFEDTRPIAAGVLLREGGRYQEMLVDSFASDDPRQRAHAAFAVGVADATDYRDRLRALADDPEPYVQAFALAARVRMGERDGVQAAREALSVDPDGRDGAARRASYLLEGLERSAPDADVLRFLRDVAPRLEGRLRAGALAVLVLHGESSDTEFLREILPSLDPSTPEALRCVRALGRLPGSEDLDALVDVFPRDGALAFNLEVAVALAKAGHHAVEPLLAAAVWRLPWNLSVLGAGVVRETRGEQVLLHWATSPPDGVATEDVRRLGYAIGELGGLAAVEELRRRLGTTAGAERPVLQGAVLGALASRTR